MASITLPAIRTTREQLIEDLEARRAFLQAFDAETLRKHKTDEVAWLKNYRARLREMLKLDYDHAKHHTSVSWDDNRRYSAPPDCPAPMERKLDDSLRHLRMLRQDRVTVSSDGQWRGIYHLLTFDPTPVAEVC